MQTRTLLLPLLIGLLLVLSPLLFGCSHDEPVHPPTQGEQQAILAKQLKSIDDNPNMPPDAKAAAKADLLQHQNVNFGLGRK